MRCAFVPQSCGVTGIVGRRRPASSRSCRTRSSSPKCLGGDVMITVESRYDFEADGRYGRYGRGGSVGAVNSGASTGVGTAIGRRRAPAGRPVPPRPPHPHPDRCRRTQPAPVLRLQLRERAARGRSRHDFRRRQRVQLERLTVSLNTPAAPSSPWVERSEIESFVRHSERSPKNGHRLRRLARSEKDGRSTFPATATEA